MPVLLNLADASYRDFIHIHPGENPNVLVKIAPGCVPVVRGMKIFDADGIWALSKHGNSRLISWNGGAVRKGQWGVRLAPGFSRVTVHCDRGYKVKTGNALNLRNPVRYPLDQMLMMYALSQESGLIFHACGAALNGKGVIFAGVSGAGKSTLAGILRSAGWEMFSDDRIIVRAGRKPGTFRAFGTPWPGDAGIACNDSAPLSAILLLSKSRRCRVSRLSPIEVLRRLLPAVSIAWHDPDVCRLGLETLDRILKNVPVFDFEFTREAKAANTAAKALHL